MRQILIFFSRIYLSKNIVREYSRKILNKKIANPGIQKRLNIFQDSEIEDFDELESDFMAVGNAHREYENELQHYKEKEKYWIVQRKYFKEHKVNFLSWNDKEQIRHLHQTDPSQWSIEQLSEAFPALPDTIQKIIKGKWQKENVSKKAKHDKAVENNWRLFEQGHLSCLSPKLKAHLKKFSNRKDESQKYKSILAPDKTTRSRVSEFSSIIQNYEQKHNITNEEQTNKESISATSFHKSENTHVTLDVIKKDIVKEYGLSEDISKPDKVLISTKENNNKNVNDNINVNTKMPVSVDKLFKSKYNTELVKVNEKPSDIITYPERIKIPKDKYKKGCTYKINDCYYDDDGEFLYRVPGMY